MHLIGETVNLKVRNCTWVQSAGAMPQGRRLAQRKDGLLILSRAGVGFFTGPCLFQGTTSPAEIHVHRRFVVTLLLCLIILMDYFVSETFVTETFREGL